MFSSVNAKRDTDDIYLRVWTFNRGKERDPLHLLPTRNTWSLGGP